ncbi:MAG: hypothetical protein ACLFM0_10430 [Spirochaetales bacterium]
MSFVTKYALLAAAMFCSLSLGGRQILAAQESDLPRVAIIGATDEDANPLLLAVTDTVQSSVTATLEVLPDFEAVFLEEGVRPASRDRADLIEFMAEQRLDGLLFVEASVGEDNTIELSLDAFDAAEEGYSVEAQEVSDSLVGVFDASQTLVDTFVEQFSGERVAFGSLEVDVSGGRGTWGLYIDDSIVGENVEEIGLLPAGSREVSIRQDRLEDETVLYSTTLDVEEGESYALEIDLPNLTDTEASALEGYLERAEEDFNKHAFDRDSGEAELEALAADAQSLEPYAGESALESFRTEARRLEHVASVRSVRAAVVDTMTTPLANTAYPIADTLDSIEGHPSEEELREEAIDVVRMNARLLHMDAVYEIEQRDTDAARSALYQLDDLDSRIPEAGIADRYEPVTNELWPMVDDLESVEQNFFWPATFTAVGAGLSGAALYAWLAEPDQALLAERDEVQAEYNEVEPSLDNTDELESLSEEISWLTTQANIWSAGRLGATAAGPALLGAGSIGFVRQQPTRIVRRASRGNELNRHDDLVELRDALENDDVRFVAFGDNVRQLWSANELRYSEYTYTSDDSLPSTVHVVNERGLTLDRVPVVDTDGVQVAFFRNR